MLSRKALVVVRRVAGPSERRIALPLLCAVPVLFAIGVSFGYFVALPAATRFFVNFNAGQFNVLVQAGQYYKFAVTILLAMGVVFASLALVRRHIPRPTHA